MNKSFCDSSKTEDHAENNKREIFIKTLLNAQYILQPFSLSPQPGLRESFLIDFFYDVPRHL
jgi:hypothetical protein